jgi:hypothetical protein
VSRDELADLLHEYYPDDGWLNSKAVAGALTAAGYRKLEPAWLGSLEHDDTHEFVNTSHCDGEHIARWRRTPELELAVKAGPWELVEPEATK